MSYRETVEKQQSSDFDEAGRLHRDVLAAAFTDSVSLTPGSHPTRGGAMNCMFEKDGAAVVALRVWGAAPDTTKTCALNIYLFPNAGEPIDTAGDLSSRYIGTGIKAATLTFNLKGNTVVNKHPVLGTAVAATTFYEISAVSASGDLRLDKDMIRLVGHDNLGADGGSGDGKAVTILVDMGGYGGMFVGDFTASGVTRIVVEVSRVA